LIFVPQGIFAGLLSSLCSSRILALALSALLPPNYPSRRCASPWTRQLGKPSLQNEWGGSSSPIPAVALPIRLSPSCRASLCSSLDSLPQKRSSPTGNVQTGDTVLTTAARDRD
jgi:hypothetical protein